MLQSQLLYINRLKTDTQIKANQPTIGAEKEQKKKVL